LLVLTPLPTLELGRGRVKWREDGAGGSPVLVVGAGVEAGLAVEEVEEEVISFFAEGFSITVTEAESAIF